MLTLHPLAELFPEMTPGQFSELRTSIDAQGLEEPITLYEGQVLDGRNRLRACLELKIDPRTVTYRGKDPLGFVIAKNVARRHLSETQRALVAARIANMRQGERTDLKPSVNLPKVSLDQAAGLLGVSVSTVQGARKVLTEGAADLVRAVEQDAITVSAAKALLPLAKSDQSDIATIRDEKRRRKAVKAAKVRAKERRTQDRLADPVPLVLTSARASLTPAERSYTVAQWEKLSSEERADIIDAGFACKAKMNDQPGDAIEWARRSLNTVTGCLHDCPYCYARDIATSRRMAAVYPNQFTPTFHPSRLSAPSAERLPAEARSDVAYRNVFANSMSDLFGQWVPADWIEANIEMARRNPNWNFLVLTKFPQRAADFDFPKNWWMGTTVDAQSRVANAEKAFAKIVCGTKWLSVEPLLQPLTFTRLDLFQWIVIGGASPSEHTPIWPQTWQQRFMDLVAPLHAAARAAGLRIYYKTNAGMRDELRIREFPWDTKAADPLPKAFRYLKGL